MSATSSIEWTDRTWNPVRGCSVISPGCVNCYAMKQAHRFSGKGKPYHGLTKMTKAGPQWTGYALEIESALREPLSWRQPARVFVNSMSDLFHESVSTAFIDRVFGVMAMAKRHTFQVLTKRPQRMREYLTHADVRERIGDYIGFNYSVPDIARAVQGGRFDIDADVTWPLPNVWLGVSVEDQKHADERVPQLLQTPAAVRFISAEPLLGPVKAEPYVRNTRTIHVSVDVEGALANRSFECFTENGRTLSPREAEERLKLLRFQGVKLISAANGECVGFSGQTGCPGHQHPRLDWVIVGGESGPGARPFDLAWGRSIVQQCQSAGVPVFMKQLGARPYELTARIADNECIDSLVARMHDRVHDRKGGDLSEWPEDLRVRQFPEARA